MTSIEIIKSGVHSTIQDGGRSGCAYYAIPKSGVLDYFSMQCANKLVNNPSSAPVIEFQLIPSDIIFLTSASFAISGGGFSFFLNKKKLDLETEYKADVGDKLTSKSGSYNAPSYLAIKGIIIHDKAYNSYSTYVSGGIGANNGKKLTKGDVIHYKPIDPLSAHNDVKDQFVFLKNIITIYKGPEYYWLEENSQKLLQKELFKISSSSNRMGARLTHSILKTHEKNLNFSVPVLPGFIQLPPNGQIIVSLQDGQTTGGYPRIAYMREQQIWAFNRIGIGNSFKFKLMD